MARPRSAANKGFPKGMRCRNGYYSYTNPVDGTEIGLGRDKMTAWREAARRNAIIHIPVVPLPEFHLTHQEIVYEAQRIEFLCAVYFLINGPEIVYVGQSRNVHSRIGDHLADGVIKFDRFRILPCPKDLLPVLEAQYILMFKPKGNRIVPTRPVYPAQRDNRGGQQEDSGEIADFQPQETM